MSAVSVYSFLKDFCRWGITGAVTHYYGRKSAVLLPLYFIAFCRGINLCCGDYQFPDRQLAKHIQIDIRIRWQLASA
ncbi:hypothetical protein KCP77_06465 [Salmonella enterica subsp. enterica]|nr:hypothetical protein KCP77_06465 [Salmonella enterica subsp. enterica]